MATNVETLKQEDYLKSDNDRLGTGEADRIANMGGTPDDKMSFHSLLALVFTLGGLVD